MTRVRVGVALLLLALLAGCGDPVERLLASADGRTMLWNHVATSADLSGQVVDRLLAADSTRTVLIDRLMANGEARQALIARVGRDRMLMDGAVHFAVQDSLMRDHLTTLFKGMEMASGH